jgi:Spy/CpxP family protein refolding chaperone
MAANRDHIELIRARSDEQVLALLSPQQKAMFVRMTGKRLNLTPPMPPECG